jgi:hypothetical protein
MYSVIEYFEVVTQALKRNHSMRVAEIRTCVSHFCSKMHDFSVKVLNEQDRLLCAWGIFHSTGVSAGLCHSVPLKRQDICYSSYLYE